MIDLNKAMDKVSKDIEEVNQWAEEEYNKYFAPYFKGETDLYNRMKSSEDPITDSELEWILTDLPLELFCVTEQLSRLKTSQEVIKIAIKKTEREYIKTHTGGSESKRKEEASELTIDDKLLVSVYDGIADRVSRQMTFSKELIMSAKKIWDARRSDGTLMPEVNSSKEVAVELPEYDMSKVNDFQ